MTALLLCWLTAGPIQFLSGPAGTVLEDARGVTGPEPAPPDQTPLWRDERAWAVAIVLLAAGTALIVGRRRPAPTRPEPPPTEWAAAELNRLSQESPNADALAKVLRGFLVRRYSTAADGATTSELIQSLGKTCDVEAWRALLERCDAARFSETGFGADDWLGAVAEARRLTAETLPIGGARGSAADIPRSENA